jgi:hypothetical protein
MEMTGAQGDTPNFESTPIAHNPHRPQPSIHAQRFGWARSPRPSLDFWKANRRRAVRHQSPDHQEDPVNRKHRLAAPDKSQIEAGLTDIGLMQRIQYTGVEEQCLAEAGAVRVSATLYPYLGLLA